jgi:hypothetical protein
LDMGELLCQVDDLSDREMAKRILGFLLKQKPPMDLIREMFEDPLTSQECKALFKSYLEE